MYSITNIYMLNTASIHPSNYNIKDATGLLNAYVYNLHVPRCSVSF